jgi:hypothetical protein
MFAEETKNLSEAQKKEFMNRYEDGLNENRVKSALHSIDMSLSVFGGPSSISLSERPISRVVFYKLFSNPKVHAFFTKCQGNERISRKEFEEFEKVCQGITTRIAQTSLEVIFKEAYALPHTGVDLWVIETEWRELTTQVQWTDEVENAISQLMGSMFDHLVRLTTITSREVDYTTIAFPVVSDPDTKTDTFAQEAFMEASISLLRGYLLKNYKQA